MYIHLRLGANLLLLRDLSCLMQVPMFSPFRMQSAAAPFYPLASAMWCLSQAAGEYASFLTPRCWLTLYTLPMGMYLAYIVFTPPTSVDCWNSDAGEQAPAFTYPHRTKKLIYVSHGQSQKNLIYRTNTRFPANVVRRWGFSELAHMLLTSRPLGLLVFAGFVHY